MEALHITAEQARLGLRAMKVVALANGVLTSRERELLDAAGQALGIDDVGELNGVAPEELAAAIDDPTSRLRLVQAMMVMALIDGDPSDEEAREVDRFARALGVEDPRIRALHDFVGGHLEGVKFEQRSRGHARPSAGDTAGSNAVEEVDGPEAARARARYDRLAGLPADTLGRAYWEHLAHRHALPLPAGAFAAAVALHDLAHVLSGYGTDPEGEAKLAAFAAGFHRADPFAFVFGSLLVLGRGTTAAERAAQPRAVRPKALVQAFERGVAVTVDLLDGWDPWPLMELPIAEVRRRFNLAPALVAASGAP